MALPAGFQVIESPFDKKETNVPEGFELIENPFKITPSAPKEPESIGSRIAGIFSKAPSAKGFASNAALTPQEQAIYEIPQEGIASLRPPRVVAPEVPVTGGITYDPSGQVTGMTRDAYIAALAQREKQTPDRSISDAVLDSGITLLKGTIGLPEAYVGLLDIPTLGYAGKILEQAGFKPKESKAILDTYFSEAQQVANRRVSETKGFLPTIGAALENPSVIATSIGESLPSMVGGAAVGRGLLKAAPSVSPLVAGAVGEGVFGAGSAAEQARQESKNQLLSVKQALAAIGSGAGTAAFSIAGGKLAHKLGLEDIDTLLVSGPSQARSKSVQDFAKKALGSGISEGLFEEMPQSAQEQMWMNYATDKPILQGVSEAAAMGALAGFGMGLGAGAISKRPQTPQEQRAQAFADLMNESVKGSSINQNIINQQAISAMQPDRGFQAGTNLRFGPDTGEQAIVQDPNAPTPPAPAGIAALTPITPAPIAPAEGIAALAPSIAPAITSDAEAQDRQIMLDEAMAALGKPTLSADKVEKPTMPPAIVEEPKIVSTYDMGENTEFRVIQTPTGYIANLYDKDSGKYVPGANRIFKTEVFGNDALPKAIEFAQSEQAKIVQPEGTTSVNEAPQAKQAEAQEQQAASVVAPAAPVALKDRIGLPEGPARENAKHEEISLDDALLLQGMIVKIVEDGLSKGKTRQQIVDQLEALTKGGIKLTDFQRINDYLTEKGVIEVEIKAPAVAPVETKAKTEEDYRQDIRNGMQAINAFRDKKITQEQYEQYQALEQTARQELSKLQSQQAATLSPAQQEAIQIAEQMEALGEKNFSTGIRSAARNPTVESNLPFYRERLQELTAQQGKTEAKKEGFDWQGFLDPGEQKYYGTFQETAPQQAKDAFENITNAILDVTNAANNLGYKINDIKKNASLDARQLGSQYTNLLSDGLKILSGHYAIQSNYKRANPEKFNLLVKNSKDTVAAAQQAIRKAVPKPEEVAEAQQRVDEGGAAIRKIKTNPKLSLWSALKGSLGTGEMSELFPGKVPLYAKVLQTKTGRGDLSDIVADGKLDDFLPPNMRHDVPDFDAQVSTELIKERMGAQNYLSYDTEIEIETIFGSIEEAERIVNEYLTEQEQNYELEEAANEQRESEGVAFSPESEGEISTPEPDEGETLTRTTPEGLRAEEERRKKIEAEEAKAKKEAKKAAEDKAKADAEVGEFILSGSKRAVDVADAVVAASGQKDIFAQKEEKPVTEEGVKVVPFEAESSVVGDLLNETREEENPFDTRFNALMHPKDKPAKPKPTTFMTTEEAEAELNKWKAEARRQGATNKNFGRTILSLFDASGEWAKPWQEAGYNVWTFDIQNGEDINDFSADFLLNEGFGDVEVWGILAAPPCTDFSSSGAQYWAKKDANGQTELSNELVRQTLRTVEFLQPKIWALENPIGRIAKLNNLPPAHLSFDPNFYGDPYTKRTLLWGNFENNLPMAPVEATEGSRIINLSGKDKYARSLTPEGFAYAFFMANNAESMTPAERLTRTYFGVDPAAFEGATKEDEQAIKESDDPAFEDNYYDGELETAADIARSIIGGEKVTEEVNEAPIEPAVIEPVKTPEGGAMRYPMASVLFNDGYQVLPLISPRTYVDKGGEAHRTFEKNGVRISLTPQLVLFQNKNAVLTGQGESTDLVVNALLVDPGMRGKGAASDALQNLTDAANQYGVTLYIEPVPIVNLKEKNVGLDRQQLEDLYKKFGFDFAEDSNKVMVREPEVQKAGNEEVLGPVEKPAAPQLKNEPYTLEGDFTEVGEEKQHLLLSNQSSKLTESQNQTLETQYGAKRDTTEFLDGLRKDVIAFITQGAKAVNGKIRAIIRQVANGVLSVAIVFNPQFVSKPYTIAVPQYDVRTSEVIKDLPKEAKTMSDAAKRAYGVIYPALEAQLKANDKLFIVADKQSGNTYMFNPDGSLLLQSKTLFGKAIGDYMHGDNEIVANRITPAGVFDLGLRDAKRSAGEAYTAGDYDFGKVFVLDKSHMGKNGPYSNTIMHSVWTNETDAKQRLAALNKPGAEDSRYSFGCINVNKETFKYLITNHLNQIDGAKIFIVPENGTNVMDFINGKAMNSDDIIRQRVEPVTKTTVTEKKAPAPKPEAERKIVGREEEAKVEVKTEETKEKKREDKTFYSIEPTGAKPKLIVDVPNENWLQGKVDYAIEKGRNKNGVPHMSTVTGRFNKPVEVSLRVLSKLKGESNEQENVRQESLDYIRKNWDEVSKEPPYIEVAYNGEAYVSEGNHRIMVALEKGLETMPVEIRYFDGGERKNGPLNPGRIPSLDEAYNSIGRTRETEEGQVQRSASLKRDLKTLNRMRKDGRITDEQFVERADAAILADEQQRLKEEPSERKRGFLHIQTRLNQAVDAGDISREARDLATWFMVNNEDLVSDLGVSIIGKGKAGQGGQYNSFNRIMTVIKNGGSDLVTVHEILHHLERMMPPKIQQAIRKAWASQLVKAQKAAKTPAEKLYFAALMEAHYGENSAENIEIPKGSEKLYEEIKTSFKIQEKNFSSENLANELLVTSSLPISNYEYFNPSEFWAVNGSDIVKARFDSVKGGTLARLKNWLKELGQKIKSIFGLKSDASIIRALDSLAKSDGKFVTDEMLGEGDYQAVIKNYKGNAAPTALWNDPTPSFMDGITYQLADKQIDTKRVIEEINKTVGQIDERLDAYTKESLYSSKSAAQIEDFLEDKFEPLLKKMKDDGIAHTDLEKYLHNRHAEERNEQINKINLSPDVQDIGSGIDTADARAYLASLPAAEKAKLDSLAAMVDDIIEGTQKLLVDGGLETQETIDTWNKTYKHYIPLQRDDLDFVHTGSGYSGGVATKGSASKRAVGSIKPVKDILANIAIQREKAIRRSEQAHVGRALYGLAITSPNPGFWLPINPNAIKNRPKLIQEMVSLGLTIQDAENLIQEPKVPVIDKVTGLVKYQVNPSMRNSENVFSVRINGEDRFIIFNPKDERAMRMARSLKNLDADELGWFLGNMGLVTRWIASINTQYNPVFGAWNMARDVQSAALNLSTTEIAGKEKEVLKGTLPAMFAIWNDLRGKPAKNAEQQQFMDAFNQMRLAGGTTGFAKQFSGQTESFGNFVSRMKTGKPKEKVNIVEQELKKLNQGNVRKAVQSVFNFLSDYNDAMENAVRLSAFRVALAEGHSEQKAASIAKELTVNFNRKGASSPTLQALYAFINASIQGTVRLGKTLKGPAGRKIIAGGITLGVIQAIALALNGYDDGDPPDFLKDKNFIIPIPFAGKNYVVIPMPMGFNIFPGIGRILTDTVLIQTGMLKSNKSIGDKVASMGLLALDAFNPLGAGSLTQMLAPTMFDPLFAISANKDAFGRPISKEDRSTQPTPGFQRSRDTATAISQGIAEFMNYVSSPSGTKHTKGWASPTADQIDYLAGQYFGGVSREIIKGVSAMTAPPGEEVPAYKRPIIGKLYGETESAAAVSSKFYDNVAQMAMYENEIKQRQKNKEPVPQYLKANPEAKMWQMANGVENQVSKLNLQKKEYLRLGKKEQAIGIDKTKTRIMKQFNDRVKAAQ